MVSPGGVGRGSSIFLREERGLEFKACDSNYKTFSSTQQTNEIRIAFVSFGPFYSLPLTIKTNRKITFFYMISP